MTILAHKRQVSKTEVLRQAISSEFFLKRVLSKTDEDPDSFSLDTFERLFGVDERNVLTDDLVIKVQDEFGLGDFDIDDITGTDFNSLW